MTHFAWSFPPVVATACPVGRPSGWGSRRMARHSSRMAGPPLRWIAPSTPPPPSSVEFAAFTIASASCSVISPRTRTILGSVMGRRVTSLRLARARDLAERLLVPPDVLVQHAEDVEHHRRRDANPRHHPARHLHAGVGRLRRLRRREVHRELERRVPHGKEVRVLARLEFRRDLDLERRLLLLRLLLVSHRPSLLHPVRADEGDAEDERWDVDHERRLEQRS